LLKEMVVRLFETKLKEKNTLHPLTIVNAAMHHTLLQSKCFRGVVGVSSSTENCRRPNLFAPPKPN
jgi:hypothetical protein